MKNVSLGIRNELNYYRNSTNSNTETNKLNALNNIFFQEHLFISSIESSIMILMCYKNRVLFSDYGMFYRLFIVLSHDLFYCYYVLFLLLLSYSYAIYVFITLFLCFII